jgi:nucleoside-diphosphate-sugar epimerase
VIGLARFSDPTVRESLEYDGVDTLECDLFDQLCLARLPEAPNVIFMAGQKFGTGDDAPHTWAVNAYLPGLVAERFRRSRIVACSTGNVYPLWPVDTPGPSESDPTAPIGEYAQSALARERVLEFCSWRNGTAMTLLRLNYAVEPRYGVLRDIADQVRAGKPVDLGMGQVNLIWQRDANAIAIRALEHCSAPPFVLNLTGSPAVTVREIAQAFGRRWGIDPIFRGREALTALLSNPARCEELFGKPEVALEQMVEYVAGWIEEGGRSLEKPTQFAERDGRF